MLVYFLVFIGAAIIGLLYRRVKEKRLCSGIFIFLLFCISTLRSADIGSDYRTYISIFNQELYIYGKGYNLINYLASLLGDSYVWLAMMVNIVIFTLLGYVYKKEVDKKYYFFALTLWVLNPYCFIQSSMNILRQGCAMACVLVAVYYIRRGRGKLLIFLICILIAGSFHKSAYFFVMLFPFGLVHWKRPYHILLLAVCTVLNLLFSGSQLIQPFAKFLGYSGYLTVKPSQFDMPVFTLLIVFVSLYLMYRYPLLYTNEKEKWYVDLYLVSLSALLILVKNDIAYRMYIYFSFAAPIAISYIVKNLSAKVRRAVETWLVQTGYLAYYSAMYWLFVLLQMINHNEKYFPYRFFW